MKQIFVANSMWHIVVNSSMMSKIILVLSSLVLLACLFVFIYQLLLLKEKYRQIQQVKASIQSIETLDDLISLGAIIKGTFPGSVLGRGLHSLKTLLVSSGGEVKKLHYREFELLQDSLDHALQDVMYSEVESLPILSVSAAVSPLVGLFGTISGLIQSFIAISHEKNASIAAMAPGISEALLTTFAGLVVAIPALVMYHYLQAQIYKLEHQLISLIHRFEWVVKSSLVD